MSVATLPAGAAPLQWTDDADLRPRNTFDVAARARRMVQVRDAAALPALLAGIAPGDEPVLVLGGGSNLLFAADPPGIVLAMETRGIAVAGDDGHAVRVRADAGVDWHALVQWTLAKGLSGLENLALVPGTVGAAPIQNIGAYGVELDQCVDAVEAFDRHARRFVRLGREDCGFSYRDSRFKHETGRWVVTAVELLLSRTPQLRLDYAGIGAELAAMGVDAPTPVQVAEAVCRIRRRKLPDPARTGNAGSFFKNPIVATEVADRLRGKQPALPTFDAGRDGLRKLSAAWLIDACGWKGHRDGDAGVSADHALVLVNHGSATGAQLLALARDIAASVLQRFGVALEPEPRIIGARW